VASARKYAKNKGLDSVITQTRYDKFPPGVARQLSGPPMLPEWIEHRIKLEANKENLSGEDLADAKLNKAKLDQADLSDADLTGAYLIKADLRGANLSNVNFTKAVLVEADLSGANMEDAELEDAHLNGANLEGVINLTADQLDLAFLDKETKLPDNIEITWINEELFECKDV
jgi:uncharacterized protein YjbI with pentapeptide repeats